jgi:chromosome segregation protein
MHFTKMKMAGFKSFVEPTEFVIESGLTGIVGPNGCGKSNVVESLRWGMGENSAKRLRGGDMDDVIFSGSAGRPSRNLAEVSLYLDNRERTLMSEFNNEDEVVITRRIERGQGSDYRINGKPVRQKDVHLLFADQATGAHSTSIVSQGRISALIQAKPQDRRQVLEEAAGISGLHARRHEAELKLKGAEANLTRVDDQVAAMDGQLRGLKTQVRQASRYRNLAELIKKAEASLLYLKAKQAEVNLRLAEDTLAESDGRVRDLTGALAQKTTIHAELAATLNPLRQEEAAASAIVQRLVLESETLAREEARLTQEANGLRQRMAQAEADRAREEALGKDAEAALTRLAEEGRQVTAEHASLSEARPQLESAAQEAQVFVRQQEAAAQDITETLARAEAQHASLTRQESALTQRQAQLKSLREKVEADIAALEAEIAKLPSLALAQSMVEACETDVARKQGESEAARGTRQQAEEFLGAARATREQAWSEKTTLEAEAAALEKLLRLDGENGTPLSDLVKVKPGFEAAFAAAFGDALTAPLDALSEGAAKIFWQDLPPLAENHALPSGATALKDYVEAPAALSRALSQIGLVDDAAKGESLAAQLKPGQIIVTRDGAAWRWDGYTLRDDAVTPAATRLQQRNRLAELRAMIEVAVEKAAAAQDALAAATRAQEEAGRADQSAAQGLQQSFAALNDARRNQARELEAQAHKGAQLQRLKDQQANAQKDMDTAAEEAKALTAQRDGLPALDLLQENLAQLRVQLAEARAEAQEKQGRLAGHERELASLATRQRSIETDRASWQQRAGGATARLAELDTRLAELTAEMEALAGKPAQIQAQRQELLTQKSGADERRQQAADRLAEAESKTLAADKDMRATGEALSGGKENRVRAEEQMFQAQHLFEDVTQRITEQFHCAPDALLQVADVKDASELPPVQQLEHDFARYNKEREGMGPVNLRAEIEADELQGAMDKMTAEKDDLVQAIAKLRQGIGTLNKEARERLDQAFNAVNTHFSDLFTRMFGGGKAHLQLIESDDPLEAGLEIFASPPGKRLQALSLLSGGEQALTALSLLFALFLVNPSPICVLDEVDAPLDEANVDRYCSLLREMAEAGKTRFLIITHHRLTMARMDRLYGVTMAEKGVSQLVSVDLKQALAFREQGGGDAVAATGYIEAAAE